MLRKSKNSYSTNGICRVNLLSNSIVGCPFVPFLLAMVLSVLLRFTDSEYSIGIFKFFLILSYARSNKEKEQKNGGLGITIMCPSGATCLPMDCCFSGVAL